MRPIITLTTDFGEGSPYVAQMKGVLLSLAPASDLMLVDVTHRIRPQGVFEGAVVLDDVVWRFPPGSIHVAVVDPGVGTSRRMVFVEAGEQRFLAPDNGLLGRVLARHSLSRAIALTGRKFWATNVSNTFHGRDILAPIAARLAAGLDPVELGPMVDDLVSLQDPQPVRTATGWCGEVIYVDSFGNLITNLTVNDNAVVRCGDVEIGSLQATYGVAPPGTLIALRDSQGRLEIAVVNGNAAVRLNAGRGTEVYVD